MNTAYELQRMLYIPISLTLGWSYADFWFYSHAPQPLDAELVWREFTRPKNPWIEWWTTNYPPGIIRQFLGDITATIIDRIGGIKHHYDLSNEFYQLFLDREMFYSCADFIEATDTLETAQKHKVDYLMDLIDPQPNEKILELGCGWGAMMQKIVEKTEGKADVTGYTLSLAQKEFSDRQYNLNIELKDFVTADYGTETFDKIYSIGAIEHVPQSQLLPLAQKLAQAIKPTGKIVHHFFCQLAPFPPARLIFAGIDIFPGAELASLKQHLDTFEAANLKVVHHSVHDYRPTLQAWFERLAASQKVAIQLVGIPTYNKYLCYLALAWRLFDERDLMLMRFVLQRK